MSLLLWSRGGLVNVFVMMTILAVLLSDNDDYSRLWALARENPDLGWKDAKQVRQRLFRPSISCITCTSLWPSIVFITFTFLIPLQCVLAADPGHLPGEQPGEENWWERRPLPVHQVKTTSTSSPGKYDLYQFTRCILAPLPHDRGQRNLL